jgi:hypothetical protein
MSLKHALERQGAIAGFGAGQRKLWRHKDLKTAQIVNSRMTLKRLVDSGRLAPGRLISPNARVWTDEEIEALIASAPTARKSVSRFKGATAAKIFSDETRAESGASVAKRQSVSAPEAGHAETARHD